MDNMESLLEFYLDQGWSIIPIKAGKKTPQINWQEYQTTPPTKEQVFQWLKQFPNCNWAVVTGRVSNLFIVDCDSIEAEAAAEQLGLTNSCSVSTPNGRHFYFNFLDDGNDRKTISGHGSKGTYWPQVVGLDARSEGGYALLPPSSGYEWDIEHEDIPEEITDYKDWDGADFSEQDKPTSPIPSQTKLTGSKFSELDLTDTTTPKSGKNYNATRAKYAEIAAQHPNGKIPRGGSGIHDATYNFLAEEALIVGLGPPLETAGRIFMTEYFETELKDGRFETSLATVRKKEYENHPERFDANGNYTYNLNTTDVPDIVLASDLVPSAQEPIPTLTMAEASKLSTENVECWQYPWLPKASIVQVYGYSGHGKSLFLQHALHHAGCHLHFGPFERADKKPVTLYMDFENGKATLGRRTKSLLESFGDPKDDFAIWTPWLNDDYINLREPEGVTKLLILLKQIQPDILVIDTLRSAYPGLNENNAEEWASINQLSLKIRNTGCTVILVHHSNKPNSDGGLGREAGSSNQLTTLETQLRITQVFDDNDMAKTKGGLFSGDLAINPFYLFQKQMPKKSTIQMVFEVSYGKVREWTDLHDAKQYIGLIARPDGRTYICSTDSPKIRLKRQVRAGDPLDRIINTMGRPLKTLEEWAEEMGIDLPKT